MTPKPPIEDVVRDWLSSQTPPRSADVVAENVLTAIPTTGQDAAWRQSRLATAWRGVALIAAVLVAAVVAGPPLINRLTTSGAPVPTPSPSPTSSPTDSLAPGVIAAIDMGIDTWSLAVDDRSVWVQVGDVGVQRVDRATNTNTMVFASEVPALTFAGPDLWALDVGTGITRLDPITGDTLETIPGISAFYIAVDGTTAWVTDVGHSLDRVDLATGKVVTTIDVPAGPKELVAFEGSVWVVCDTAGKLVRVDVETNEVVAEIDAGNRPGNLAAGEGAVWVWNHDRELLRVDPAENKVVATVGGIAETLGAGVTVGGGFVWVAVPTGIGKVDPATNTIVGVIPLGPGDYVDLAWFDGELWASTVGGGLVYRLDPAMALSP